MFQIFDIGPGSFFIESLKNIPKKDIKSYPFFVIK